MGALWFHEDVTGPMSGREVVFMHQYHFPNDGTKAVTLDLYDYNVPTSRRRLHSGFIFGKKRCSA
jgi:hypothetical protein